MQRFPRASRCAPRLYKRIRWQTGCGAALPPRTGGETHNLSVREPLEGAAHPAEGSGEGLRVAPRAAPPAPREAAAVFLLPEAYRLGHFQRSRCFPGSRRTRSCSGSRLAPAEHLVRRRSRRRRRKEEPLPATAAAQPASAAPAARRRLSTQVGPRR